MLDWINARYGSRRGFVDSKWHQLKFYLGRYQQYEVPWDKIERLVFICTGNICRSAFAEAVAKSCGLEAISAGVHASEGAKADSIAIRVGKTMGYDLDRHRTTPVMYPQYRKTDLFLAMEPWQAELVQTNLADKHYTTLLGMWGEPKRPCIYDPFMRPESYFENCFNYIENTVNAVAAKITKAR